MASPLDVGLLKPFTVIFSMLLVYAVVYGILSYSKVFGEEKKGLYAIIALAMAIMVLVSPSIGQVIRYMTPWFAVFFIFLILMLVFYRILGADEDLFLNQLKKNRNVSTWILIFSFLILVSTLGYVYFSPGGSKETQTVVHTSNATVEVSGDVGGTGPGATMATIFHPKVLGLIVLLLVGVFASSMLSGTPKGPEPPSIP